MNPIVEQVTHSLVQRSEASRDKYLERMKRAMSETPPRKRLSCGNLAHAFAASPEHEKKLIASESGTNLGIITAYNDMLSAHQPLKDYPDKIKARAFKRGATAQIAGGVPAMCDGVTQGQAGMELSLFSRDVVAMATAVGLTHNMFDANLFLGVCDKIVPGMLMGALEFGHLPAVFVPAGPMPSGISNKEKAEKRQLYAEGKLTDDELLAVESASYHSPGTCTFYGTANSNQMLMEMLGVQLPGASFVPPNTPLREALTDAAVDAAMACTEKAGNYRPLYDVVTEKSLVNALVGLLATGGSTNHSLHLVAIARSAGIQLTWEDMDALSAAVPLLCRIYPNGQADVNHFQDAGGMAYLIHELRLGGLLNEDVTNISGECLNNYEFKPELDTAGKLQWQTRIKKSSNLDICANIDEPFSDNGGLRLLQGNLGKAVIKTSAVEESRHIINAPAIVFQSQAEMQEKFANDELFRDHIAVVRFQGPKANGMPELHKLTPLLGVVQDRGFKVALVTDGRMSGASGKVPAAIHLSPEALAGGLIGKVQTGDMISLDCKQGTLELLVSAEELAGREAATPPEDVPTLGRPLFQTFRESVDIAQLGATTVDTLGSPS